MLVTGVETCALPISTIENVSKKLLTPIPAQNFEELLKSSAGEDAVFFSILSGLDLLGVGTYVKKERKKKKKL